MEKHEVSAAELDEMRGWLSDCQWTNVEPEEWADFDAKVIIAAVARYYEGGVSAFLRAVR